MTLLSNQCLLDKFNNKCVDDMSDTQLVSFNLRCVPTLVIPHPNGKSQVIEGENTFKWLQAIIENQRQKAISQTMHNRKLIQMATMKNNIKDGLYDYQKNESEGISDSYAYWNDDMTKELESSQPKSFLPYKCDDQYRILVFNENEYTQKKLNQDQQTNLMKKLQDTRSDQDTGVKTNMEQQQVSTLNAILNS